jgi:hypothetical protein
MSQLPMHRRTDDLADNVACRGRGFAVEASPFGFGPWILHVRPERRFVGQLDALPRSEQQESDQCEDDDRDDDER